VSTGPSSARTWEASSGGLLVKKESANFLERRELQSTLRVTAYVLSKKGLSIGMVNRKGFAEAVWVAEMNKEPDVFLGKIVSL
jgi:hypothetical protein